MKKKVLIGIAIGMGYWIVFAVGQSMSPEAAAQKQLGQYRELFDKQKSVFEKLCDDLKVQNQALESFGAKNPDPLHCTTATLELFSRITE